MKPGSWSKSCPTCRTCKMPTAWRPRTIAIEELETQLIVLDDGFQHRRLGRDLDIVLLDALEPFGFEHVFPRGTLREPLAGLQRADAVILSRADMLEAAEREKIRRRVRRIAPKAVWAEIRHAPHGTSFGRRTSQTDRLALQASRSPPSAAWAIRRDFATRSNRADTTIAGFRDFPDHHRYSREDIESLADLGATNSARRRWFARTRILVKIGLENLGGRPLLGTARGNRIFLPASRRWKSCWKS